MKKVEELFQRFEKVCKAIPKIGGMLAAGGRIGVTVLSVSYELNFPDALFLRHILFLSLIHI